MILPLAILATITIFCGQTCLANKSDMQDKLKKLDQCPKSAKSLHRSSSSSDCPSPLDVLLGNMNTSNCDPLNSCACPPGYIFVAPSDGSIPYCMQNCLLTIDSSQAMCADQGATAGAGCVGAATLYLPQCQAIANYIVSASPCVIEGDPTTVCGDYMIYNGVAYCVETGTPTSTLTTCNLPGTLGCFTLYSVNASCATVTANDYQQAMSAWNCPSYGNPLQCCSTVPLNTAPCPECSKDY